MLRQSVPTLLVLLTLSACDSQRAGVTAIGSPSSPPGDTVVAPQGLPPSSAGDSGDNVDESGAPSDVDGVDIDVTVSPSPQLLVEIGESIFNDPRLSSPAGQSCASCHSEEHGFTDPDAQQPSSLGADGSRFGTRNSPTLFYLAHVPDRARVTRPNPITFQPVELDFGGFFVDGRADTLEQQALAPLFNASEMALPSALELQQRIQQSDYAARFVVQFGATTLQDPQLTARAVASAVAAFERTARFAPFSSRFDDVAAGRASFTAAEARGQQLFNGRALCAICHQSPGDVELFSDFLYHNVGTPRNPALLNAIGDDSFVDRGLGAQTSQPSTDGQFRTPTLRNVALSAPYMHNGVFATLREVVNFYNDNTSVPEVAANVPPFIGNLGLSQNDVDDLVAFLNTLTDR